MNSETLKETEKKSKTANKSSAKIAKIDQFKKKRLIYLTMLAQKPLYWKACKLFLGLMD